MNKPKKSMKIKIKRSKACDAYSSMKYDNRVLSWMEFKMRLRYNTGRLSRYTPTDNEQEVLGRNLGDVIKSYYHLDNFTSTMIRSTYEHIKTGTLVAPGLNKRALVNIIDIIREYWISTYPDNIFKKEVKNNEG